MVELDTIAKKLDENRLRFVNEKIKKDFEKWNKSIQYYSTYIDKYWHFILSNGNTGPLNDHSVEDPDISYEMSTDTFIALNEKKISGMKAYNQKLVKVKAKLPDLIKLQKIDNL